MTVELVAHVNGKGSGRNFHPVTVDVAAFREAMLRRGWESYSVLGDAAGVSQSTVSALANGTPVTRAYAERVVATLTARPEVAPAPAPDTPAPPRDQRNDDVDALVALTRSCLGDDPAAMCAFIARVLA
jgi:hypothetical protein